LFEKICVCEIYVLCSRSKRHGATIFSRLGVMTACNDMVEIDSHECYLSVACHCLVLRWRIESGTVAPLTMMTIRRVHTVMHWYLPARLRYLLLIGLLSTFEVFASEKHRTFK